MKKFVSALLFLCCFVPMLSHAWWNGDWAQRRKVTIDTSAKGVETKEALAAVTIPVRLHSGNFSFADAKEDGSDLRFVAGDDKTPLKFQIETFDPVNELALVWVQIPKLSPGAAQETVWLYFANPKAAAEPAKGVFDASHAAVFHFDARDPQPRDASDNGNHAEGQVSVDKGGLLGGSANFNGTALRIAASPSLRVAAGGEWSVSAWVKPTAAGQSATLYSQQGKAGKVELATAGGKLAGRIGGGAKPVEVSGGEVKAGVWTHVAMTVGGGHVTLYINGAPVASGDGVLPDVDGAAAIGTAYAGQMDELQVAKAARSESWVRVAALGQGQDSKLLSIAEEGEEGGGGHSYFGILIKNLTTDAWVVIIILMVMFAISAAVMAAKARMVARIDRGNQDFLDSFRDSQENILGLDGAPVGHFAHSSLYMLYQSGTRELKKRLTAGSSTVISPQSIDAIKASIDADLVRETHRLNGKMVLLTIAISGGPFLGLLGTVVGVMITFAAIAAAGDVNVNSIAPGIAAALMATVAGLAVAIPALFGYNYLASRIKNITADMQIFVDELVTRIAEDYCN